MEIYWKISILDLLEDLQYLCTQILEIQFNLYWLLKIVRFDNTDLNETLSVYMFYLCKQKHDHILESS